MSLLESHFRPASRVLNLSHLIYVPTSTERCLCRHTQAISRHRSTVALEEPYRHTTGQWLYNNIQQHAIRYSPFDVEALKEVACHSAEAKHCTSFTKIGEGSYNKVFLLELDNGVKATARIPGPVVGNLELSIASEAATLTYLRDGEIATVPRVLAWNASEANPVKWPYIITEYFPGIPLQSIWAKIRGDQTRHAVTIIMVNNLMTSRSAFSQIGSLYFKKDVSPELQARPLFENPEDNVDDDDHVSQKYRIGPIVDRQWWRGARRHVDADRGPWPDTKSYIIAAALLEQQCISQGIDLDSSYVRSRQEDVPEIQNLLDRCIAAAPYLVPTDPELRKPTILHPDLSGSNIIVAGEDDIKNRVIIDWQGTIVAPFFMECMIPPVITYRHGVIPIPDDGSCPELPSNIDSLPADEQECLRIHYSLAGKQWVFVKHMSRIDPKFGLAWSLPHWHIMCELIQHICRCWANGPVELRQDLIGLEDCWSEFSSSPCPFHFTMEERARHDVEYAAHIRYASEVNSLMTFLGCADDGWVANDRLDEARRRMEEVKQAWDAGDAKGPFPFQDGAHCYFLT
ncbi:Altered inheritance of mitochondria protein 9, mitochondrial [Hypsizygus marmoreus]|uniref:Altered inheritance of mitochondria protein 9, mitochondrial n=1 Tax=Hypsizygus marmoreus TaxID=39966 RepID=A0A369K5Z0_HYPMA|nr:Altered inheritance of mitochondria protein 9, mitochondrial [Hypsizygus marmoreus]